MIPVAIDFSPLVQAWDVASQHGKLIGVVYGLGLGSYAAVHWWIAKRSLKKGDFRRRILFFAVRFEEPSGDSGPVEVHFKPIGDEHELHYVVGIPALESKIARATRNAKDGLLCLKHDGPAHKRMMHIYERKIQGNDPIGMSDWIKKRPTNDDVFAFMPAYYREEDASMIYVFVVDGTEVLADGKRLRDHHFRARMVAADKGHHDESVNMVKKMGEQPIDPENKSEETALVRFTPVTTAKVASAA